MTVCACATFILSACGPAGEPPAERSNTRANTPSPSNAARPPTPTPAPAPADARACPMHCEPGKHYADRDACPVCRMGLLSLSEIPYSVQLVPVAAPRGTTAAGRFEMRVIDPTGSPTAEPSTLHRRAYVAPRNLSSITPISLPETPTTVDLSSSPQGLCVLAGRLSAADRPSDPFLARFMNGRSTSPTADPTLKEDWDRIFRQDDLEFRIRCNGEPYPSGREMPVRIALEQNNTPLPAGAFADAATDLVFISADLMTAVFGRRVSDPSDSLAEQARTLANGRDTDAIFGVVFPRPGLYRGFITLRHDGRDHQFAFTFDVKPSGDEPAHDHDHHAHAAPAGR